MCQALCFTQMIPSNPCQSEKYNFSLSILQMRNLRPTERHQTFTQGHTASTRQDRSSLSSMFTNFDGSISPPSFANYTFCLYIVNFHLMYCFAGVPYLWCVHPNSQTGSTGNSQGQARYPNEFGFAIFSYATVSRDHVSTMQGTQSRQTLRHLSQPSRDVRYAQVSLRGG